MCMSRSMQVFRLKEEGFVCMCLCMCVCARARVHAHVQARMLEKDKDKQESWENFGHEKITYILVCHNYITASGRCNG